MFKNIEECLSEYEEVSKDYVGHYNLTEKEKCIIDYFDLHFAEAIMKDFHYSDKGVAIAKIILAMQGLSNEIKVKIE